MAQAKGRARYNERKKAANKERTVDSVGSATCWTTSGMGKESFFLYNFERVFKGGNTREDKKAGVWRS